MHKADGRGDDACRTRLPLANQVAEFHESRWRISESKESIGMFLYSKSNASLSPCYPQRRSHFSYPRVAEVALRLDAQTLECPLADAACHHGHVGHDGFERSILHLII